MGTIFYFQKLQIKEINSPEWDSYTLPQSSLCSGYCWRTEMNFAFTNETRHNLVLHGLAFCNTNFTQIGFMK